MSVDAEFLKLKQKSWHTFADFEKDLEEFEVKTATAHRIDKSDLVTTTNVKRTRLGQEVIPEEVKYTRAVYVCCHFGQCHSKSTGQRKCRRYVLIASGLL